MIRNFPSPDVKTFSQRALAPPRQENARRKFWLYPQLLSLDTPLVAVVWQLLFMRSLHVEHQPATSITTFFCVWTIYAADHLLDVRRDSIYSERHDFVQRHSRLLLAAVVASICLCAATLPFLPKAVVLAGAGLSSLVVVYLLVIYLGQRFKSYVPKEFLVALLFATGCTLPVWSEERAMRHAAPAIALFTMLCLLNSTTVDYKEWIHSRRRCTRPHPLTRWFGSHILSLSCVLGTVAVLTIAPFAPALAAALALAAFTQVVFSQYSHYFEPDAFRFLADMGLMLSALMVLL
jgi:hypothetical protein